MSLETKVSLWARINTPKLALLANGGNPNTIFDMVAASFAFGYTDALIDLAKAADKNDLLVLLQEFIDDNCFYEIGLYIMFMLDVWHVTNGLQESCRTIFDAEILPRFVWIFKTAMEKQGLQDIQANRFEAYGTLVREKRTNRIRFYFEQALEWATTGEFKIIEVDKPQPLMIAGAQYDVALAAIIKTIHEIVLPNYQKKLLYVYTRMGYIKAQ